MRAGPGSAGLAAHLGVLVEPGPVALRRDLDDHVLLAEQRLAAEPRLRADVERHVEAVLLGVLLGRARVLALEAPHVAGGAGAVAAAGAADPRLRVDALGGVQDRGAGLRLDRDLAAPAVGVDVADLRHGSAAPALPLAAEHLFDLGDPLAAHRGG